MMLNNLFSEVAFAQEDWVPILPSRRHSMPGPSTDLRDPSTVSTSSALHTLVSNLRSRDLMTEIASSHDESQLLRELQRRVGNIRSILDEPDADLATALVSLL